MNRILPFIAAVLIFISFNSTANTLTELIGKAEQGDTDAQYILVVYYQYGQEVNENQPAAKSYYRQTCNKGHQSRCDNYKILFYIR